MSIWELPKQLKINGKDFRIRYQFGAILDILTYFGNPNYEKDEQWEIALRIFYPDFDSIPFDDIEEAAKQMCEFIDVGVKADENKPSVMDWEQDAPLIIPAVNKVLGHDVRTNPDTHWWTFQAAYMEIGESLFANVLNIRTKQARNKKLEKNEREFYRENKNIIDIHKKLSDEELGKRKQEEEALKVLIGG